MCGLDRTGFGRQPNCGCREFFFKSPVLQDAYLQSLEKVHYLSATAAQYNQRKEKQSGKEMSPLSNDRKRM
ncbi:hypothetical protein NDU88_002676 [Pleurodeles waltl]|uniref:Uncharacterized protein n=1 Tax=Pleurodeles waltl TaxID=8319 RepID=A0AAV7KSU9_PLEWA|nr:hypothetical protein NDU88_002676 [Pleurodeles waltl]